MVRALDSVSSGPGPGPDRGHCCVLWGRHFTLASLNQGV